MRPVKSQQEAFYESFYKANFKKICAFCYNYIHNSQTAEDLAHDSFAALWKSDKEWEQNQNVFYYLLTIAKNNCINYLRKKQHQNHYLDQLDLQSLCSLEHQSADLLLCHQVSERFFEIMDSLPVDFKETYLLSREKGYSYKEIAEQQNISTKTVEFRVARVVEQLKKGLEDYLK